MHKKLSQIQSRFIEEYLVDRNPVSAGIRAGLSEHRAKPTTKDWLTRTKFRNVQDALREALRQDRETGRLRGMQDRIIQERAAVAFASLADCYDPSGKLLPWSEIPDALKPAIKSYRVTHWTDRHGNPRESVTLTLHSKHEALTALEKMSGLTRDRIEMSGSIDVTRSRQELEALIANLVPFLSDEQAEEGPDPV